jgi:hypothetical protein
LLSFELGNLMRLPAMSAASIFQGVEATPGRNLGEGLKRSLAAKLTPESATDLKTSFQGISRAVAALESGGAATGLVGLTQASEVYMPQPTDTVGNVWRKMATLRGILERGLESAATAKDVTPERKKLYEQIKEEVRANVPWTVEDVTKLNSGKGGETYQQLFKRMEDRGGTAAPGARAAPAGPATAGPASGDVVALPSGLTGYPDGYGFKKGDEIWVKQGNKLVKSPGGVAMPPPRGPEFSAPVPSAGP